MFRNIFGAAVILLILAGSVQAQGLGIGPQLGYQKTKDADNGVLMYGAALRFKLSPAIGIEGAINYRREEFANGGVKVSTWPVMVTGLFYPIPVAYGLIGLGWYNTTFDYGQELTLLNLKNNTQQNFGWHLGAGVEVPLGQTAWLTGDVRYVFLNTDFGQLSQKVSGGDFSSNFYIVTVGLLFGIHN